MTESAVPERLVGRDLELAWLADLADRAAAGRGAVIEIVGAPGSGRTALLNTLATARAGLTAARCAPQPGPSPYRAVQPALGTILGCAPDAPADRLVTTVTRLLHGAEGLAPLLAPCVGVELEPTDETRAIDEAFAEPRRHMLVADLLAAAAAEHPIALLADDLETFDAASRALIEVLARRAPDDGYLIATAWAEPLDASCALPGALRLALPRLTDAALEAVLARRAGLPASRAADEPDAARIRSITLASRGNVGRALAALDGSDGADAAGGGAVERAASLGDEDRALLDALALSGGDAPASILADVAGVPAALHPDRWAPLARFVTVSEDRATLRGPADCSELAAAVGAPVARRIHARLAEAWSARGASYDSLVARHAYAAGDDDTALAAATRAAERSRRAALLSEAQRLYRVALDTADRSGADDEVRCHLAESLGDVGERSGDYEAARIEYERARDLAADPIVGGRIEGKLAWVVHRQGHYAEAIDRIDATLTELDSLPPSAQRNRVRADLATARGACLYGLGSLDDARMWNERAATEANAVRARDIEARAHTQLEIVCAELRDPAGARHGQIARRLFVQLGDDAGLGNLLSNLAITSIDTGDVRAAVRYLDASVDAHHRAGDTVGAATTQNNQAELLTLQHRDDEAAVLLRSAQRVFVTAGDERMLAIVDSGAARLAARRCDHAAAAELLSGARRRFEHLGAAPYVLDTRVREAELAVLAGEAERALALADELAPDVEEHLTEGLAVFLARQRAEALCTLGALDRARLTAHDALAQARAFHADFEVFECLDLLDRRGLDPSEAFRAERAGLIKRLDIRVAEGDTAESVVVDHRDTTRTVDDGHGK